MLSIPPAALAASKLTSSTTALTSCSTCKMVADNRNKLVRVHAKTYWHDRNGRGSSNSSLRVMVCGYCLVGFNVPALRPSTGRWEFGTVRAYDSISSELLQYQIEFVDEEKEWVHIWDDPFEAYVRQFEDPSKLDSFNRKNPETSYSNEQKQRGSFPLYTWDTFPRNEYVIVSAFIRALSRSYKLNGISYLTIALICCFDTTRNSDGPPFLLSLRTLLSQMHYP